MVAESIALIYLTARDREGLALCRVIPIFGLWAVVSWLDEGFPMYYACCKTTGGFCIPRAAVTGNSSIRRSG
jgi:hypothetical protein